MINIERKGGINMSIFGNTMQMYVTGECGMGCPHCSSRHYEVGVSEMTIETFLMAIKSLEIIGIQRVELFANDPVLWNVVEEAVNALNRSDLEYAILTVGASPKDAAVRRKFLNIIDLIDPKKGGLVFSVDYHKESAEKIVKQKRNHNFPYAFKAKAFWDYVDILKERGMPIRTNTVISKQNIEEVFPIIHEVLTLGFAASCCFVQTVDPMFIDVVQNGLILERSALTGFKEYLQKTDFLTRQEIDTIVEKAISLINKKSIVAFNKFRGFDASESKVSPKDLIDLRKNLIFLKQLYPQNFLPGLRFLENIGKKGIGCFDLLQRGQFPQLKIGPTGQIRVCCDLHDPESAKWYIWDLIDESRQKLFLQQIRTNPYVWICNYFNPCDFSVNWVKYQTK